MNASDPTDRTDATPGQDHATDVEEDPASFHPVPGTIRRGEQAAAETRALLMAAMGARTVDDLLTPSAQDEYDTDPQLRELLHAALTSPTVHRTRQRRT